MTPRIVFSALTKRWYVLTRYRTKAGRDAVTGKARAYLVADDGHRYDVTEQMATIFAARRREREAR